MNLAFWRSKRDDCSTTKKMLSVYMDGHLSPAKEREVEQHLRTCQNCRQELDSLQATVTLLRRLPEAEPSRSFTLAAVRPALRRSALPALRYAMTAVAILLALSFAADWTNLFGMADPSADSGEAVLWLVPGQSENATSDSKSSPVYLVVAGSGESVYEAVKFSPEDTLPSGSRAEQDGILRLVLEGSDNTVLYSFNLDNSVPVETKGDNDLNRAIGLETGEVLGTVRENQWLRLLEYSLIGLMVALGIVTISLWIREKRSVKNKGSEFIKTIKKI